MNTRKGRPQLNSITNKDCLSIHVTDGCNLRCTHCYQENYEHNLIPLKFVEKAVNLFDPKMIVLYGGEPMVAATRIMEIMKLFPDKKYMIYTNGTIVNEVVFDALDKIVITMESFLYQEAVKYRRLTRAQLDTNFYIIDKYKDKVELLHNIYPLFHDKYFYRMARTAGVNVQTYPLILNTSEMSVDVSKLDKGLFAEKVETPLVYPKLRLLVNGDITRDMRGKNIIGNIMDMNCPHVDSPLEVSDKCKACKYYLHCPACNIFPHFCKDILEVNENPHFCKFTEELWKNQYFSK